MAKALTKTVWVLTSAVNDYNQHGDYFEAVFLTKPTPEQLAPFVGESLSEHVAQGGGRLRYEHSWYRLDEVEAH